MKNRKPRGAARLEADDLRRRLPRLRADAVAARPPATDQDRRDRGADLRARPAQVAAMNPAGLLASLFARQGDNHNQTNQGDDLARKDDTMTNSRNRSAAADLLASDSREPLSDQERALVVERLAEIRVETEALRRKLVAISGDDSEAIARQGYQAEVADLDCQRVALDRLAWARRPRFIFDLHRVVNDFVKRSNPRSEGGPLWARRADWHSSWEIESALELHGSGPGSEAIVQALEVSRKWDRAFEMIQSLRHRVDRSYLDPRSEDAILAELRRDLEAIREAAGAKASRFAAWLA